MEISRNLFEATRRQENTLNWTHKMDKAFHILMETATTVAKKTLEDVIPRYGLPSLMGSGSGLTFIY